MKKVYLVSIFCFLTACGGPPNFEATTVEGAQCKNECATNAQQCSNKRSVCEDAYEVCIDSCKDVDKHNIPVEPDTK